MSVPVGFVWEGLVQTVVEVFVVGEDNVAADVVELRIALMAVIVGLYRLTGATYEPFRGHVGRGKTSWFLIGIHDHPGRSVLVEG